MSDPLEGSQQWALWQAMPVGRWMSSRQIRDLLPDDFPSANTATNMHALYGSGLVIEQQFNSGEWIWNRVR